MNEVPEGFAPWQARAWQQADEAIQDQRLAHGMLICGPAALGKRVLAEQLAHRILCESPTPQRTACRKCRSCQLLAAGTHPDYRLVTLVPNKEGTRLRTEIVIDQIRELTQMLALTAQYGRAQIVIIDPADAINHAAANALLKTLEEPQPGRYLWLLSANPARLPATIRSRCQKLELRLPARVEAMAWLQQRGHAARAAAEALDAARGHPGLADSWLREGQLELRRDVANDLAQLAGGKLAAAQVAQRWTGDELAGLRLRFAADIVLDIAAGQAADLTDPGRTRRLAAWFDSANRTRDLLRTTVRADLAVLELLSGWQAQSRTHGAR